MLGGQKMWSPSGDTRAYKHRAMPKKVGLESRPTVEQDKNPNRPEFEIWSVCASLDSFLSHMQAT